MWGGQFGKRISKSLLRGFDNHKKIEKQYKEDQRKLKIRVASSFLIRELCEMGWKKRNYAVQILNKPTLKNISSKECFRNKITTSGQLNIYMLMYSSLF